MRVLTLILQLIGTCRGSISTKTEGLPDASHPQSGTGHLLVEGTFDVSLPLPGSRPHPVFFSQLLPLFLFHIFRSSQLYPPSVLLRIIAGGLCLSACPNSLRSLRSRAGATRPPSLLFSRRRPSPGLVHHHSLPYISISPGFNSRCQPRSLKVDSLRTLHLLSHQSCLYRCDSVHQALSMGFVL